MFSSACWALWLLAVESGYVARGSADRGGVVGGGVRIESTLQLCQTCRKAALRLTVNPFGSQARHFPYIALTRRHRGRHCGSGLWLDWELRITACSQFAGPSTLNCTKPFRGGRQPFFTPHLKNKYKTRKNRTGKKSQIYVIKHVARFYCCKHSLTNNIFH